MENNLVANLVRQLLLPWEKVWGPVVLACCVTLVVNWWAGWTTLEAVISTVIGLLVLLTGRVVHFFLLLGYVPEVALMDLNEPLLRGIKGLEELDIL